ncbi:ribonuclease T2 [Pacificibacter maritimus]|uniref:Ribonuclease T2 n=1 Tax=Pacificibacter maritimus TaxID=762213 RepID=A0A3N4U6W8_9RHOB|nr:ribonuclease T2 [Pacificibacter maritimus]RPE66503.1 ribonuclease T2 [Pacificibacter maritimus]
MRKAIVTGLLLAGVTFGTPAFSDGERAGDFDYYVLAMSWSPTWCALEGEDRNSPQCDRKLGWVLHGLWPQYERGWPSYCNTSERDPSRRQTAAMEDIMGTDGAAWYQWKKHGRCAGLPAQDYLDTARDAFDSVTRPDAFRNLDKDVLLPASVVEQAFMSVNDGMDRDEITVTCKANRIQEVRICLSKDLELRSCGQDTIQDCTLDKARLDHID